MVVRRPEKFTILTNTIGNTSQPNLHTTPISKMSREGFVAPSGTDLAAAASGVAPNKHYGVKYTCGACAHNFSLNKSDPVRCKECGHRVIYKARTKRMSKFLTTY